MPVVTCLSHRAHPSALVHCTNASALAQGRLEENKHECTHLNTKHSQQVCTCSQFHTEAMQWIKEVELVDSVDELKSSSSSRGISMPNFEVLDARIASALNKIIHNSQFKRRISLEEQKGPERGPFPSWQTDCLLDLRTIPGHWNR